MKILKPLAPVVAGLAIAVAAGEDSAASAQTGQFIGSRTVSDATETDTIQVQGGQAFSAIRLCVAQRAVNFRDLDVFFANGGHQDAAIRNVVPAGQCTRWVDLSGQRRNISHIVMVYDTRGDAGPQAEVSAFGR